MIGLMQEKGDVNYPCYPNYQRLDSCEKREMVITLEQQEGNHNKRGAWGSPITNHCGGAARRSRWTKNVAKCIVEAQKLPLEADTKLLMILDQK